MKTLRTLAFAAAHAGEIGVVLTDYEMPPADKPLIPLLRDFL